MQLKHQTSDFKLSAGLILDARRALWMEEARTLAVADLHLGYAWAHRHSGQLLPLSAREDSLGRLLDLIASYAPRELVLLGDIVHRAVPVAALKAELRELMTTLGERVNLTLVAGNHDRHLQGLLADWNLPAQLVTERTIGDHLLVHGDGGDFAHANKRCAEVAACGGRVIIGHEHPAISISDKVTTSVKCPCFLASERVLVLPAFSNWAAGANVRSRRFMSPFAKNEAFATAFAVIAGRILPIRL